MKILIVLLVVFILYVFPRLRCLLLNLHRVVIDVPKDLFLYFKQRKYNNCRIGEIVSILGYFGKGKTLTVVYLVAKKYFKKDNKKVWCSRRKKLVRQRIKIISNVELIGIPYEEFASLEQIVYAAKNNQIYDDEHDTLTITLVLGDEFSTQMNSRQFKTNINTMLLNTILTCRHYHIALYYTTQRFQLVDALLRQVTSYCISCNKIWRLTGIDYYDAWELENASNLLQVKPYKRGCWYVTNKDYNRYDTMANVDNLQRASETGDLLTDQEILQLQSFNADIQNITKPTRKIKKLLKR